MKGRDGEEALAGEGFGVYCGSMLVEGIADFGFGD